MVSQRNYTVTRSKHTRVYELKFTNKSSSLDQIDQITRFFFFFSFFIYDNAKEECSRQNVAVAQKCSLEMF